MGNNNDNAELLINSECTSIGLKNEYDPFIIGSTTISGKNISIKLIIKNLGENAFLKVV